MPDEERSQPREEVDRRGFVGWALGLGAGFVGLVAGIPLVGSVLLPSEQAPPSDFVKVAEVASIPVGEPFGITFAQVSQDAYVYTTLPHSVYALKSADGKVEVFSPVCPHLGCQVFFDRQVNEYVCPCHGSKFAKDGAKVSGPTPRGLDTLPSKVSKGSLYVQWVVYRPGTSEKIPV